MTARQSNGGSSPVSGPPSSPEAELDELRAALEAAKKEAADAAAEFERVDAEERAKLQAVLGELDLSPERWEEIRTAALARQEGAEAARDFAARRVTALRERGSELAEQVAAERISQAESTVRSAQALVIEREEALGLAQQEASGARAVLETARVDGEDLRAEFNDALRAARAARRREDHQVARWHAEHPEAAETVPPRLRGLVEAERERLRREVEEQNDRLRAEAAASRRAAGYAE